MKFTLSFQVDDKLQETLERMQQVPKVFGQALYAEAVPLMDAAVERAPRAIGGLDTSAYITPPSSGEHHSLEMGFSAPWAAYVHERMDLQHPGGGEAKFLQRALDAGAYDFFDRFAARITAYLESGTTVEAPLRYPTSPPSVGREASHRRQNARRGRFRSGRR